MLRNRGTRNIYIQSSALSALRIIIYDDDDDNYDSCYDGGKFYYVINASTLSESSLDRQHEQHQHRYHNNNKEIRT